MSNHLERSFKKRKDGISAQRSSNKRNEILTRSDAHVREGPRQAIS
jgi:hypothetical protein